MYAVRQQRWQRVSTALEVWLGFTNSHRSATVSPLLTGVINMRKILVICLFFLGACAPKQSISSDDYKDDPKYETQQCVQKRNRTLVSNTDTFSPMERIALILFVPFGTPIVLGHDTKLKETQKDWSRELHLACSSQPLPDSLR